MSTRSTTHFKWSEDSEPTAIVYRHSDGYPEGHGQFLADFLDDIATNVPDTRFSDPSYLAARLVVALAREFNVDYNFSGDGRPMKTPKAHPLDFISVGVVREDPGDIEYRYEVICDGAQNRTHVGGGGSGSRPQVRVLERTGDWRKPEFKFIGLLPDVLSDIEARV